MSLLDNEETLPDLPRLAHGRQEPVPPRFAGATSRGHRRIRNEDRFDSLGATFVVADGMAGNPGGEIAAMVAVNHFLAAALSVLPGSPLSAWAAIAGSTSDEVSRAGIERGFERSGTTLTAITVESNRVVLVHVGDSRLYTIYPDRLQLSSTDHNLGTELASLGAHGADALDGLPPEALTSYLGIKPDGLEVCVRELPRLAGQRMLLCTDGVYRQIRDRTIVAISNQLSLDAAVQELIQQSNAAGGRDNATALLVEL